MKITIALWGSIIIMYVLQRYVFARLSSSLSAYVIPGLVVILWFVALFRYHAFGFISAYLALGGVLVLLALASEAHEDSENAKNHN
ncbi:hypothetical protein EQG49_03485 [Periweissella cryptocerci]|uniref:Uncharacterized protein n=1 Tax=Periweissella cryptocerci TaxID=2506420 RepID=A0A4V1AII1_9LACO|nr:hypothetical protein [Periweissella cryptocerci]QBO35585.1 hypothetical protein EQG49_03485 [Periweissella cryptocerci]